MHSRFLAYAILAVLSGGRAWTAANAVSINLATGLDSSGNLIGAGGKPDAHWTVDSTGGQTQAAQVVTQQDPDWSSVWGADGPGSNWIARNASSAANGPAPYSFYRTFDLSGVDLSTTSISGAWELDDEGTLSLNGHPLDMHVWDQWTKGLLSFFVPPGSPYFVQGLNTLSITETRDDNLCEAVRLEGKVGPLIPGDADRNGSVEFDDLVTVARNFDKAGGWDQGDFNADGKVDFSDLVILARNYGRTVSSAQLAQFNPAFRADVQAAFAQVPEPCSAIVVLPLVGLLIRRRNERHHRI